MSLRLLEAVKTFQIRHRPGQCLQLRIGAHTGEESGMLVTSWILLGPYTSQVLAARPWWASRCLDTACSETPSTPHPGWRHMANVRSWNNNMMAWWFIAMEEMEDLACLVEYSPALIFKFQNKAGLSSALISHPCVRLSVKLFNYSKNSNFQKCVLVQRKENRYCKCFRN